MYAYKTNSARTYSLCLKRRYYPKEGIYCSLYEKRNFTIEKRYKPIVVNGGLMRLDKQTGEILYGRRDVYKANDQASVSRSRSHMIGLLKCNDFEWFLTLTFDRFILDRTDPDVVYKAYTRWINKFSKRCKNLRYITFPEQHEDGNFHFHILVGGVTVRDLKLTYSGKVCCHWATRHNQICSEVYYLRTKDENMPLTETDGLKVYNANIFMDGYSTVTRIANRERCNTYVMKYVDKALGSTFSFKKRYFYSRNLKKPKCVDDVLSTYTKKFYEKFDITETLSDEFYADNPYLSPVLRNTHPNIIRRIGGYLRTPHI